MTAAQLQTLSADALAATLLADGLAEQARLRGLTATYGLPACDVHRGAKDKFFSAVNKTETCWLWTSNRNAHGYGKFNHEGVSRLAHRVSYEWANGAIPKGLMLDHKCHQTSCVNPAHLRPTTNKQNQENRSDRRPDGSFRGVSFHKARGKWAARVRHNRKRYSAGYYSTAEEAAEAARQLRLSLYTHNDADRKAA